ncbi:MAG TPA: hypothetical protein DCY35_06190 [Prolixibacteraceae bacterium]|nr:hypothetical protein [Prolixibacteraceae bacterium]
MLNAQMWRIYLRDGDHGMLPYASPMKAESFHGLPPAYIETAEFDCLRDEGRVYANRLMDESVPVRLEETRGTIHGYDGVLTSKITQTSLKKRIEALQFFLADPGKPRFP